MPTLTKEQYDRVNFHHRRSLYPLEVKNLFDVFQEIEGWNFGCRTCPTTVMLCLDRVQVWVDEYEREEVEKKMKEEQQVEELTKREKINKPIKKTKNQSSCSGSAWL